MGTNGRTGQAARRLTRSNNASRDRLPRRVLAFLAEPLDRILVSERDSRDGRIIQYIEGWTVINQANRIFGYDGWGTELVGKVVFRAALLTDPDTEAPLAVGMYSAVVRVTVRGCVPRSDAGCAFVSIDTPEAHEMAYKGAVTDALKRALRHFGDQFGNSLYDRRPALDRPAPAALPATPAKLDAMRRKVIELSSRIGLDEAQARAQIKTRYGEALDGLTEEQLTEAIRALAEEFNRRNARSASERKQRKAA